MIIWYHMYYDFKHHSNIIVFLWYIYMSIRFNCPAKYTHVLWSLCQVMELFIGRVPPSVSGALMDGGVFHGGHLRSKKWRMQSMNDGWWWNIGWYAKTPTVSFIVFFRLCMPVYAWFHYVYQCIRYIFIILYTILCVTILSEDHGPSNPTFTFGDGTCWFGRFICGTQLCKCWAVDMI